MDGIFLESDSIFSICILTTSPKSPFFARSKTLRPPVELLPSPLPAIPCLCPNLLYFLDRVPQNIPPCKLFPILLPSPAITNQRYFQKEKQRMCDSAGNCGRLTAKDIQKRVPVFTKMSILRKLHQADGLPPAREDRLPDGNICRRFCSQHLLYIAKEAHRRLGVKVDSLYHLQQQ